jgi:ABC-type polysaccharide/polyol phosphate export permease
VPPTPAPTESPAPAPVRRAAHPPRPTVLGELGELVRARRLLWAFVWNDLRARYVGSSIGFFWTVVNPILELVTYTFVFHVLIGVKFHPSGNTTHYVLFLFCGMVAWNAFADGITRATTSIRDHAHLLRKINFPAIVLPAHLVLSSVVNQLFRLFILLVAMVLFGDGLTWHVLLLPPFLFVQACFTIGIGLLLATMNVYFRDMSHWVNAALMIGMFVTPVFYPASAYPRQFVILLYPNPMAQIVGIYQGLLLNHHVPFLNSMLWAVMAAVAALVVGASAFAHSRRQFADLV